MKEGKITLVVGASLKPQRMSNMLIRRLRKQGMPVKALGLREGFVDDVAIQKGKPQLEDIDTVTLYLNAGNQKEMEDYILTLKPNRIIFNPGAENPEFKKMAQKAGIDAFNACSMVMVNSGTY